MTRFCPQAEVEIPGTITGNIKALSRGERVPEGRRRERGLSPVRIPTTRVRELRAEQTEAETAAWSLLRSRRLGLKFHRQYPIDKYVVDFFCFERRLAFELDGGIDSQPNQIGKDTAKDAYLVLLC